MRALPACARSYRLIRASTDEGAALCGLALQAFGVIWRVTPGSTGHHAATAAFTVGGRDNIPAVALNTRCC